MLLKRMIRCQWMGEASVEVEAVCWWGNSIVITGLVVVVSHVFVFVRSQAGVVFVVPLFDK
jgi:hypothetical protein